MSKERKSTKRKYKDFNDAYYKALEHFLASSEPITRTLSSREANSSRRDFYRFFEVLSNQYDSGDSYADMLSDVAKKVIISVVPGNADPDGEVEFIVKLHPLEGMFSGDFREDLKVKYPEFAEGIFK